MVLSFSDKSKIYSQQFISSWVDRHLRDPLLRLPGIGEVALTGGGNLAYRLWLNPDQLNRFKLTINDVNIALQKENVLAALGQVGDAPSPANQQYSLPLRMEGRLRTQEEIENLIVAPLGDGNTVRLKDLGRVSLGDENYSTSARNLKGLATVALSIFQRDGSNALELSKAVEGLLEAVAPDLPPGLEIQTIVDVADNVRENIHHAVDALRDAVLLVFLVLLLGLGNWRLAVITAIAVPVSLLGSFILLRGMDGSINTLTLFGLVLASGLVVDDAIVVSEDIGRRIELGETPGQASINAMQELSGAVIATSLVLVVVFLPVLVMPGSVGKLYQPIAVVISSSILISMINALTFTPVASSILLSQNFGTAPKQFVAIQKLLARSEQWLAHLQNPYQKALGFALHKRRLVVIGLLAGLVATGIGVKNLPTSFIPQEDDGQIRGVLVLPEGASLARTEKAMEQIRKVIEKEPLIRVGNFYAGRSFGDSAANKGVFFLRLQPLEKRGYGKDQSTAAVIEKLNLPIRKALKGAGKVNLSQPPPVRGFGSEGGLELELLDVSAGGLSLGAFAEEAQDFIRKAEASGKFERVSTRFNPDSPALKVVPDRQRMAAVGVNLQDVVGVLGESFGSSYVNDTFEDGRVRRILIQLEGKDRSKQEDILRLMVRNRKGDLIPISSLVTLEQAYGPTSINHSEQSRAISIQALPKSGISSGQAIELVQEIQTQRNSPITQLNFTGLTREEQKASGSTWGLFGLGLAVVYLLLAALYESAIDPLVILITVPLGLLGVVIGLASRGLFLDVYGQVGVLVLISLAAKNGILIVEFANQKLKDGKAVNIAIREAASLRLRPILLTAVASLAGFLPLVLARGAGAASRVSIGTVVFSGLLVSTALSLFVLPVIYEIVKSWERRGNKFSG
jgi:hydrophobe/amphiphile efflux-1 (HAE1) family protein